MDKGNVVFDPGNVFGKRKGGFDIASVIDPGGKVVDELHGTNKARKAADVFSIFPEDPKEMVKQQELLKKNQDEQIAGQRKVEDKNLAEAKNEIARRKSTKRRGLTGRSLLSTRRV